MFENNYKSAMDKITLDADTRDKILDNIILKEELKKRKNPSIPWRVAFACVACVAVVLGIVFVPRDSAKIKSGAPATLQVSKSYNEIYELIREKNDKPFWHYIIGADGLIKRVKKKVVAGTDDAVEYIVEEEIVYEDGETDTSGSASQGNNNSNTPTNKDEAEDFSNTTEQVEGVYEADIVKTDGKYIYYLIGNELLVYKADGDASTFVSRTVLSGSDYGYSDMFLKDDRLIILQNKGYVESDSFVSIIIYDVSNPEKPIEVAVSKQEGWYNSSRMVGDYIYLVSECNINISEIKKEDPSTFVPVTVINDICETVPADSIYRYNQEKYDNAYTVIGAFNCKDGKLSDTASLLGGTDNIYCSKGNIILADSNYNSYDSSKEGSHTQNSTTVSCLEIKKGEIEYKVTGEVDGTLENQFFIDEHNGYFRFVTTVDTVEVRKSSFDNTDHMIVEYELNNTYACLTILNSELKKVGEIKDLAKGERVYSVRFMGDIAYFVTFRQTDPLFSADLSDPTNPKILGELKIPGFSEYMYPYGEGLLLGFGMDANEQTGRTTYLKLSMFDITDPANVTEQDKTVLDGYNYSTALDNHKSMLVSPAKNLIGFTAYDNYGGIKYMVYEHKDGAFVGKASLELLYGEDNVYKYYDAVRGLFIGDSFYLVSDKGLQVFDIATFSPICSVKV